MRAKCSNVRGPLAKRRHVQVDHAESVQQVLAKLADGHELSQIAVGRGNDAHVDDALGAFRSHGLYLAVLEESQQESLHAQAHFAQLIQKKGSLVGELQLAGFITVRAGERPLEMAEQLGLEERI